MADTSTMSEERGSPAVEPGLLERMCWVVGALAWTTAVIGQFARVQDWVLVGTSCLAGAATVTAMVLRSERKHPVSGSLAGVERRKRALVGVLKLVLAVVLVVILLAFVLRILQQSMFGSVYGW